MIGLATPTAGEVRVVSQEEVTHLSLQGFGLVAVVQETYNEGGSYYNSTTQRHEQTHGPATRARYVMALTSDSTIAKLTNELHSLKHHDGTNRARIRELEEAIAAANSKALKATNDAKKQVDEANARADQVEKQGGAIIDAFIWVLSHQNVNKRDALEAIARLGDPNATIAWVKQQRAQGG